MKPAGLEERLKNLRMNLDEARLIPDLRFLLQGARLLHVLQDLLGLFHVPFAPQLLGLGQHLPDLLVQLVDALGLLEAEERRDVSTAATV